MALLNRAASRPVRQPARRLAAALVLSLLLAALAALGGCLQADSLGGKSPDEVAIGTPPQWDNGIGTLLNKKCAVCHQVPATDISPKNIPQDFDLRYQSASPSGVAGATSILSAITGGVLRGQYLNVPQMPLSYATPLTDTERDALETWAANGGP